MRTCKGAITTIQWQSEVHQEKEEMDSHCDNRVQEPEKENERFENDTELLETGNLRLEEEIERLKSQFARDVASPVRRSAQNAGKKEVGREGGSAMGLKELSR